MWVCCGSSMSLCHVGLAFNKPPPHTNTPEPFLDPALWVTFRTCFTVPVLSSALLLMCPFPIRCKNENSLFLWPMTMYHLNKRKNKSQPCLSRFIFSACGSWKTSMCQHERAEMRLNGAQTETFVQVCCFSGVSLGKNSVTSHVSPHEVCSQNRFNLSQHFSFNSFRIIYIQIIALDTVDKIFKFLKVLLLLFLKSVMLKIRKNRYCDIIKSQFCIYEIVYN